MRDASNIVYKKSFRSEKDGTLDGVLVLTLEVNCYAIFFERYENDEQCEGDFVTRNGIIAIFKTSARDKAQEAAIDFGRKTVEELTALPWLQL